MTVASGIIARDMRFIATMLIGLALGPSSSLDGRSSEAYTAANASLLKAEEHRVLAILGGAQNVLTRARNGCRGVLVGAPHGRALAVFGDEIVGAVAVAMKRPIAPMERAYVAAIAPLKWTVGKLRRLVGEEVQVFRSELALHVPAICRDAVAWRGSHFAVLPPATKQFVLRLDMVSRLRAPVAAIRRNIAKYARSSLLRVLQRDARLERKLNEELTTVWLTTASEIDAALGVT